VRAAKWIDVNPQATIVRESDSEATNETTALETAAL